MSWPYSRVLDRNTWCQVDFFSLYSTSRGPQLESCGRVSGIQRAPLPSPPLSLKRSSLVSFLSRGLKDSMCSLRARARAWVVESGDLSRVCCSFKKKTLGVLGYVSVSTKRGPFPALDLLTLKLFVPRSPPRRALPRAHVPYIY